MNTIKSLSIILFLVITSNSFAQTNSHGNYEIYTYETSRKGFSYLAMDVNYPDYLNSHTFTQRGVMYSYQYFTGEMGAYNLANNFRMRFITEGNFNIGGGYSSTVLSDNEFKLYTAKLDIYSFDMGAEFTYVFDDGIALTAKLGMNIFSIGANVGMPDKGKFKDDLFGVANLVPLLFRPQFLIDFGRSVIGVGFIIHPKNFIEYKYVPTPLFDSEDKGIIFNDDFMTDFAVQFLFSY